MPLPGISDEKEIKLLLKRALENKEEVFKFAVAASGPREGALLLNKKDKFKKKDVQEQAEAEAKTKNGGKAVKFDVMTGECRLDATNATTLRLIVYGKAPARAVACAEHLLVRGPFKSVGFTAVILEEVPEDEGQGAAGTAATNAPAATPAPPSATASAAPTVNPWEAKWDALHQQVEPLLLRVLAAGRGDLTKFRGAWDMAQGKAEAADFESALKIAERLLPLLQTAESASGPTEAQASIPVDVVPFVRARQSWIVTRKKLFEEMAKLEAAIVARCEGDEEFGSYAENAKTLSDRLAGFDAKLEETLEKMVETPDGDVRQKLKAEAKTHIGAYAAVLKDPFFADVDKKNGFVDVAIASTARTALADIASVLK